MKKTYNPLTNRTKRDTTSELAIKHISADERMEEKSKENTFIKKIISRLRYFLDKSGYILLSISIKSKKYRTEFNRTYKKRGKKHE